MSRRIIPPVTVGPAGATGPQGPAGATGATGPQGPAGTGIGDVSGPALSVDNELVLFSGTTGKTIKRATTTGIVLLTSGVVSVLASTGTGNVVRDSSPTIVTPTIASFVNANHNHSNAAGGGTIAHTALTSIGTNTHAQIDTHLASAHAPVAATYIVQTADATLTGEQALGALGTGILKNTTTTGVLSIAVAGDFPTLNQNTTGTAAGLSATLAIGSGGTGQTTAQTAINALTAVSGATNEHVLTKDTATGNAIFKAAAGGSGGGGTLQGPYVIFMLRPDNVVSPGNAEWTNMNNSAFELWNSGSPNIWRREIDLTGQSDVQFTAYVQTVGTGASKIYLSYTTDLTGASGWVDLTTATDLSLAATGFISSGWQAIPSGMKTNVLLRVMGSGGNGTADPQFGLIAAQFRGTTGSGDMVGPSASVDSEAALFSGTTGKLLKRSTLTGIVKQTSGVSSAATAGTDYLAPPAGTAILKANSGGALANAVAGTDYYNPGGTDVAVADGGTGSSTAATARSNLAVAPVAAKYIVQSADTELTNEQALDALGTGLLKNTTGTGVLSIAQAGVDYDGGDFAVGRFTLTADGAATATTISNFFGANSAFSYAASTRYYIQILLYFLKNTAGTVTFTLTTSANVVGALGYYHGTAATGGNTPGTSSVNAPLANPGAATAIVFPVTTTLTAAVNHFYVIHAIVETNTSGNIRVNITNSAGTVTPLKYSTYRIWQLSSGNLGSFVA